VSRPKKLWARAGIDEEISGVGVSKRGGDEGADGEEILRGLVAMTREVEGKEPRQRECRKGGRRLLLVATSHGVRWA